VSAPLLASPVDGGGTAPSPLAGRAGVGAKRAHQERFALQRGPAIKIMGYVGSKIRLRGLNNL